MSAKLYVGNLSFKVEDQALADLFQTFGTVQSAKVIMDRETGRSRGFGFVEMTNMDEAEMAIQNLNGTLSDGRNIKVNLAQEKNNKPRRHIRS